MEIPLATLQSVFENELKLLGAVEALCKKLEQPKFSNVDEEVNLGVAILSLAVGLDKVVIQDLLNEIKGEEPAEC